MEDYYFEGPEKNLEVWFQPPLDALGHVSVGELSSTKGIGLRAIPRDALEEILQAVRCTILSSTHTEYMDSYVLSESSMFITPYRFILKTCGQTTLLYALNKLIVIAKQYGLSQIQELFFSRHNLIRPDMQHGPHKSFNEEVSYLDKFFDGSAFMLGRVNDIDTCYLYTLDSEVSLPVGDRNLEICMFELDPTAMRSFYKSDEIQTFDDATKASKIDTIFPDAILDGFLFEPCGYSVNGMMGKHYFTIHITPQQGFSYVSFETDMPMDDYSDLVSRVLDIFRPNRATVTVMANQASLAAVPCPRVQGAYRVKDIQRHEFSDYHLLYACIRTRTSKCSGPPSPTMNRSIECMDDGMFSNDDGSCSPCLELTDGTGSPHAEPVDIDCHM